MSDRSLVITAKGSNLNKLLTYVNWYLDSVQEANISRRTLERLCVYAGISFASVKDTKTAPRLSHHFCNGYLKQGKVLSTLFSAYSVRNGIDQKSLVKANTSASKSSTHDPPQLHFVEHFVIVLLVCKQ